MIFISCINSTYKDEKPQHIAKFVNYDVICNKMFNKFFQYVVFGPLGQAVPPSLDTMTPEQYVHTMAFRDQGFAMDRMPQYKDHTEAGQDILEEDSTVTDESTSNSVNATDNGMENNLTIVPPSLRNFSPSQPNMEDFWENKNFADCKIICKGGEEILTHRLILAAHNEYFYQLLVSNEPSENELVVIMMPDHSSQDIANMLQQLYNFKVGKIVVLFILLNFVLLHFHKIKGVSNKRRHFILLTVDIITTIMTF